MKPHIWTTFRQPEPFVDYVEFTEKVQWGVADDYELDSKSFVRFHTHHFNEKNMAQLYMHYPKAGNPLSTTYLRGSRYMERYPRNWSYRRPSKK